jgi:hypothetical protein
MGVVGSLRPRVKTGREGLAGSSSSVSVSIAAVAAELLVDMSGLVLSNCTNKRLAD